MSCSCQLARGRVVASLLLVVVLASCNASVPATSATVDAPVLGVVGASAAGAPATVGLPGASNPAASNPAASGGVSSAGSGAAAGASAGTTGGGGASAIDDSHDHCINGEPADPGDAQLSGQPDQWKASNGDIDLVVPKVVLDWMHTRIWEQSHDAWHNIRRCRAGAAPGAVGGFPGGAPSGTAMTSICSHTELVPAHQECTDAEDGYEFLVMHRHMLQALRRAYPQHATLFAGFPAFPYEAKDVPLEWQGRWGSGWSQQVLDTAKTLEDIEHTLSQFPTEGDLGKFIQCGAMSNGASSIHGALHFKWVVNESPYSLGKQTVNIDNYMFWKLHGWIDQIWERYRAAKGVAPDEPKLTQALVEQCQQMHALGHAVGSSSSTSDPNSPLPTEHGEFHESVRPILEKTCGSCHSESSPEAGMSLGGHLSSADIVANLVNVQTMHGGQFKRVVPGNPDQSWLLLKASGKANGAGCTGSACNTQVMPPTGQVTLTSAELDVIRQWIVDGAPAPTP